MHKIIALPKVLIGISIDGLLSVFSASHLQR